MIFRAEPLPSTKVKILAYVARQSDDLIFALTAVVIALAATVTFKRVTTPWSTLPDYDYWDNITGLVTPNGLDLSLTNLFRLNNDHIILIPKLVYAANYLITSGSNTGLIVYSIALGAACAALLVFLARDLLRDTPWRLAACAVFFPLVMFSAKLGDMYFRGMSGAIWLTANLFVILSAAALARAIVNKRPVWLFASLFAGLLGALSHTAALYVLIVLLGLCLALAFVRRFRGLMPKAVLLAIAASIVIALGLIIAHRTGAMHLTIDPLALIRFVLDYLGNTLTMGPQKLKALLAPGIGFIILAVGALAIGRLVADRRINDALLWIILFLYAPFDGLVFGAARLIHDPNSADASRFQSVAAISLIAAIALLLAALPKASAVRRTMLLRAAAIGSLVIAGVVLVANRAHVKHYVGKNEIKVLGEIAFRQGLESNEHLLAAIHIGQQEQLERLLPVLRLANHVPFNMATRCEKKLGQHFEETAVPSSGAIEGASIYTRFDNKGRAIEVKGWAEQGGTPAECIVIIDGSGTAIGAGASMLARPDIERDQERSLGRVGWSAVAPLPQVMPVCALAFFPANDGPVPLASCLNNLAAERRD